MGDLLKAAGQVSNMWSLAAFAIAALLFYAGRKGKLGPIHRVAIFSIMLLGILPIVGSLYVRLATEKIKQSIGAIYRVRITVLNPQGVPVDDAKVWSSAGGEPKRVEGGWQFDIPSQAKPSDSKLTIYAELPSAFMNGNADVPLTSNYNPTVEVRLKRDESASVRGLVLDDHDNAVEGASVSLVGFGSEAVTTHSDGGFALPAHAAEGQQVEVHVEKGRSAANKWVPAGKTGTTVRLSRK